MKRLRHFLICVWAGILFAIGLGQVQPEPVEAATAVPTLQPTLTLVTETAAISLDPAAAPLVPRGISEAPNGNRVILNTDDRVTLESREYPWSAVGRLVIRDGDPRRYSTCTGSLVNVDWVLTNAHCVVNLETHELRRSATFQPNLINGRLENETDAAAVDEVILGTDFSDRPAPNPNDWALLHLTQPLGRRYGTLRWQALPTETVLGLTNQVELIGYSGDFPSSNPGETAGVHRGCSIQESVDNFWVHNCDSFSGASGGPLLAQVGEDYVVVALHAGGATDVETQAGLFNYAVKLDAVQARLNDQPYPPQGNTHLSR